MSIIGGSLGDVCNAFSGSGINLFGVEFFLDGLLLDELTHGETVTIFDRDATLSGTLADGSPFSFDLSSRRVSGVDFFYPAATLTVTLVPESSTLALLLTGGVTLARRRRRA